MTIDEAIAHAKEKAKKKMAEYENHYDKDAHYYPRQCKKCAEEYEQLAEWLEELKAYKENQHRSLRHMYEKGYSKAIDDFSMEIDKYIERYDGTIYDEAYYTNVKSDFEDLKKICNQLKAGV